MPPKTSKKPVAAAAKPASKKTKSASKPRTSKNMKLAEKVASVIAILKSGKSVTPAIEKLESIKTKLSATKSKRAPGQLSEYQKFVKKNYADAPGKDAPSKMKALGAMWKKSQKA